MPLLPSHTLIVGASLLLVTTSGLLIFSPTTLLSSNTVALLGSSMHIRTAAYIPDPFLPSSGKPLPGQSINPLKILAGQAKSHLTLGERELLALLGLMLGFAALTQLVLATPLRYSRSNLTVTQSSDGKATRKSSQALGEEAFAILSAQTLWQTLAGLHVVLSSAVVLGIYLLKSERYGSTARTGEGWDLLANDVVFAAAMSDMLFWGYVYTVVKEERKEVLEVLGRRREDDEVDQQRQ